MVYSSEYRKYYALKIFRCKESEAYPGFSNESRFKIIKHENIITMSQAEKEQQILHKEEMSTISFILMEKASCDFADLLEGPPFQVDELLVEIIFINLSKD